MTLRTLGNKHHPNENNISLDWQKANIFGVGLKPSVQSQRVTGLDTWCRSVYHLDIQ